MMNTDYRIEAINVLLNGDCTLAKYAPLIPYRETLVANLQKMGRRTKSDCMALSDESLLEAGLAHPDMAALFRRFLVQYDVKPNKLKEIAACETAQEAQAFFAAGGSHDGPCALSSAQLHQQNGRPV